MNPLSLSLIHILIMDILLIFETFRNLTGLSRDEAVKWYSLCDAAAESISGKLRPEANCEKNRVALSTAAAAEAFMNYVLVCADLLQGDGEKVETLEFKGLIGSGEHTAAVSYTHLFCWSKRWAQGSYTFLSAAKKWKALSF